MLYFILSMIPRGNQTTIINKLNRKRSEQRFFQCKGSISILGSLDPFQHIYHLNVIFYPFNNVLRPYLWLCYPIYNKTRTWTYAILVRNSCSTKRKPNIYHKQYTALHPLIEHPTCWLRSFSFLYKNIFILQIIYYASVDKWPT